MHGGIRDDAREEGETKHPTLPTLTSLSPLRSISPPSSRLYPSLLTCHLSCCCFSSQSLCGVCRKLFVICVPCMLVTPASTYPIFAGQYSNKPETCASISWLSAWRSFQLCSSIGSP